MTSPCTFQYDSPHSANITMDNSIVHVIYAMHGQPNSLHAYLSPNEHALMGHHGNTSRWMKMKIGRENWEQHIEMCQLYILTYYHIYVNKTKSIQSIILYFWIYVI